MLNTRLIFALLASIVVFCVSSLIISFISINNESHNCQQVELLKTRVRVRANDDYNNLDRNAKLLHIVVTPELRNATRISRDRILDDYAPERCHGLL